MGGISQRRQEDPEQKDENLTLWRVAQVRFPKNGVSSTEGIPPKDKLETYFIDGNTYEWNQSNTPNSMN